MRIFWRFTLYVAICLPMSALFLILGTNITQVSPAGAGEKTARPKLVVLVVFDQMRGDYLEKWQPLFGPGGFKRLQRDGAWFTDCHYPYAYTITAGPYVAGHGHIRLQARHRQQ